MDPLLPLTAPKHNWSPSAKSFALLTWELTIRMDVPNAKHAIQTGMAIAWNMILHTTIHWPNVADPQLWPKTVHHAVWLHNHIPNSETSLSPCDIFTQSRYPHSKFHDLHVSGMF
jgi:hypothetical protein